MSIVETVLALSPRQRQKLYASLTDAEMQTLYMQLSAQVDNPYLRYQGNPIGFVTEVLGETLWSKQREILRSIQTNRRTAVPASHGPGKSHLAARAVAWWVCSYPVGTTKVLTTSTTFRQVEKILWPHIRKVQQRHGLPGEVLSVHWKILGEAVAEGFSSGANNEAAVQGYHAPNMLIIVDEAGGIPHSLGQALEALTTGDNTRLLILGNPPTDEEGGWFEKCCNSELYNVIRIDAYSTPNFTGEDPGPCKACPPSVASHSVGLHLVDKTWVEEVIYEFGEDSAFVEARVHARFPRSTVDKTIPLSWAERAVDNQNPLEGQVIRLGVDVASDGGDELAIARATGWRVTLTHKSAGSVNANAVDVAGVVLGEILAAEGAHRRMGIEAQVRVKIDALGVGWGVVSLLQRWGSEGRHHSEIVGVKVSERALSSGRFANQRAEMWWTGRELLQPAPGTGAQSVALDVDRLTLAQLATPKYKTGSDGRIAIERKVDIKARGGRSPDRAEAVLLALYEPRGVLPTVLPISLGQNNPWAGVR